MTMTTERPTSAADVPAWLNLDAVCPPEVRAKVAEATELLEALIPDIAQACRAAWDALRAAEAAAEASGASSVDDLFLTIDAITGVARLRFAAERIIGMAGAANGGDTSIPEEAHPSWYGDD